MPFAPSSVAAHPMASSPAAQSPTAIAMIRPHQFSPNPATLPDNTFQTRPTMDPTQLAARAYGHAARYWARLGEIAGSGVGLLPLPSHEDFEAEIRARHGRKSAFWAHVNGTRRDRHDDEDDLTP